VVFVTCSFSRKEARTRQIIRTYTPPLGLASLAAYVIENGFSAAIVDALALELGPEQVCQRVKELSPKVIGLTSITPLFEANRRLAGLLRSKVPEALIVLGGHHATIFRESLLETSPEFDIIVYGEGERSLLSLVEAFAQAGWDKEAFLSDANGLSKVPGIIFRTTNGATGTERPPLIDDLDTLPFPARHLLPMHKYVPLPHQHSRLPAIHVMGSRGCTFNCYYCNNTAVFGRRLRLRSPENIIAEIEQLKHDYGAKEIFFWDDTFTANRKWVLYADFHVTTPFPGTRIYQEASKHGRLNMDFTRYDCYEPVFVPWGYKDEEQIKKMLSLAKRSFYFRPSYAIKKLAAIRSFGDIYRIYKGFTTLIAFLIRSRRYHSSAIPSNRAADPLGSRE